MPKSDLQKAMEQQKKLDRENRNREYAKFIVDAQPMVSGFRVMDADAEALLKEILTQYDGNDKNHVGFRSENLPRSLTDSIAIQYEKLKLYGMLSFVINMDDERPVEADRQARYEVPEIKKQHRK